jgi:surfactin synthase thioesterase subunit/cytochrome P450
MRLSHPTDPDAVDLDLRDPATFRHGDPHAVWHAMRHRDPVHWQPVGDTGFWSVTRYRDVEAVLRDTRTFTSEGGTLLTLLGEPDPASRQQLSTTDPPRHTQMRAPLQKLLVGRTAERHTERVRAAARRILAPAAGDEPYDFGIAVHQLPVVMFGTLMDLPEADWPRLTELAEMAVAPDDPLHQLPAGAAATQRRAHRELFAYFSDAATRRRKALGEDLLSVLLTMEVDGEPLDRGAVMANCYLLLIGSTITVPEVPKAALLELIHSGRYADWAERPDLLDSGVEEALRWSSPANHVLRYATRDTELHGRRVAEGDGVVVWYGSANRPVPVRPRPQTQPPPHLRLRTALLRRLRHRPHDVARAVPGDVRRVRGLPAGRAGGARRVELRRRDQPAAGGRQAPPRTHLGDAVTETSAPTRPRRARAPRWFLRDPGDTADARLFCLPYSGCGASMYRQWPKAIGGLEICPIQPPGRENRLREPAYESYEELAAAVIDAISPHLDRPFGFFGHCGSALSSYEVAVQLAARGGPVPTCVFVSSQVAPHEGPYGSYLTMDDDELREEVRRLIRAMGGTEPREDLVALSLRVMRADVNANKAYRMARPVPLPCRVSAIGWADDTNVPADLMPGWRDCGRTVFRLLAGSHFSFLSAPEDLRAVLLADMGIAPENGHTERRQR